LHFIVPELRISNGQIGLVKYLGKTAQMAELFTFMGIFIIFDTALFQLKLYLLFCLCFHTVNHLKKLISIFGLMTPSLIKLLKAQ